MTKSSWRKKLLVVPAVLSLALGGALLTATSASAAPGGLVITAPTAGQTVESRNVTFSGQATTGSKVVIYDGTDKTGDVLATINSVQGGAWTASHLYTDDEPVAQSIYVDGVIGGSGFSDAQARAFNLPAIAPQLTVTSPTEGKYLDSRTVTVTGTGIPTASIALVPSAGNPTTGIVVRADGTYTGTVTFPSDVDRAQSIVVNQIQGGAGRGSVTVNVNLPATQTLVVETPKNGDTTDSRDVTFSGTGTPGSNVSLTGNFPFVQAYVGDDSTWTTTVTFADDAATDQSVRLTQVTGGVGTGDVTVAFSLPAVVAPTDPTTPIVLDAPVITSPEQDEVVTGDTVTFEGTGTPGSNILVVAVPSDQLGTMDFSAQAAEPADPTDPIVVDADGNWTVTLAVEPGDYTAQAISFLLDADGQPVLDADGVAVISDPSNEVDFSVVAAAVVPGTTPIGSTPVGTTPVATGSLAFTGSDSAPVAVIGGLLALAGAVLSAMAIRRRRALNG